MTPPKLHDATLAATAWDEAFSVMPIDTPGLINGTWVLGNPPVRILQWLNPLFAPEIHHDIFLLTERLTERGIPTPHLQQTRTGTLWHTNALGTWRVWNYIPGRTLQTVPDVEHAREGGRLVGRFHAATANWTPKRHAPVRNIHDTDTRMNDLQTALMTHTSHPLYSAVAPLAEHILTEWQKRRSTVPVPQRICHGDLKISNLRFASEGPQPICLVDLDTIGPMELACELGDMWRSWCNPAGEDDPSRAAFDVALFRASARGFLDEAPELEASERAALPTATTRICLELASRFAADALNNNYFREDRVRFPDVGTHNLHRATTQLHLARSAAAHESICADILNA